MAEINVHCSSLSALCSGTFQCILYCLAPQVLWGLSSLPSLLAFSWACFLTWQPLPKLPILEDSTILDLAKTHLSALKLQLLYKNYPISLPDFSHILVFPWSFKNELDVWGMDSIWTRTLAGLWLSFITSLSEFSLLYELIEVGDSASDLYLHSLS